MRRLVVTDYLYTAAADNWLMRNCTSDAFFHFNWVRWVVRSFLSHMLVHIMYTEVSRQLNFWWRRSIIPTPDLTWVYYGGSSALYQLINVLWHASSSCSAQFSPCYLLLCGLTISYPTRRPIRLSGLVYEKTIQLQVVNLSKFVLKALMLVASIVSWSNFDYSIREWPFVHFPLSSK